MGRVPNKKEPVRAVRQWRNGPVMWLHERGNPKSRVRVLRLGKGADCELQAMPDPTIEDGPDIGDVHCTLICTGKRVTVCGIAAAGPTWVNEIHVLNGQVEVRPGNVITVGTAQLVVCGDNPQQQPDITAPDIPTLIAKTRELFDQRGQQGLQADALKVPRRTYYDWLEKGKFMTAAAICLGLGGLAWSQVGETDRVDEHVMPAAAATAISPAPNVTVESATSPAVDEHEVEETAAEASSEGDGDHKAERAVHGKLKPRAAKRTRKPRTKSTTPETMEEVLPTPPAAPSSQPIEPNKQRRALGGTIIFDRAKRTGGTLIFDDNRSPDVDGIK